MLSFLGGIFSSCIIGSFTDGCSRDTISLDSDLEGSVTGVSLELILVISVLVDLGFNKSSIDIFLSSTGFCSFLWLISIVEGFG